MGTKQLVLSAWLPSTISPAFAGPLGWRVVAPGGETTAGAVGSSNSNPTSFWFTPAVETPISEGQINRSPTIWSSSPSQNDYKPLAGWNDEFFQIRLVNPQPYASGRQASFPNLDTNFPGVVWAEYCVNVEVDYPDVYMAQILYVISAQPGVFGAMYVFPGDLFNIALSWESTPYSAIHFRGGAQSPPVIYDRAGHSYDADGLFQYAGSQAALEDYDGLDVEVSGLLVTLKEHARSIDENDPIVAVGWSIEPRIICHAWDADLGVLNSDFSRGVSFFSTPGQPVNFAMPHEYSTVNIRREYFTSKGRLSVVGMLRNDPTAAAGGNHNRVGNLTILQIALPEQRTAIAKTGPFIQVGASQPGVGAAVSYIPSGDAYAVGAPADLPAIRIAQFDDLDNQSTTDVSARIVWSKASVAPFDRADSVMMGSGLCLFQDEDDTMRATWWLCGGLRPYDRYRNLPYSTGRMSGSKWFESATVGGIYDGAKAPADVNAIRYNSRIIPGFHVSSYFLFNPRKAQQTGFYEPFYQPPGAVDVVFSRIRSDRSLGSGFSSTQLVRTVATLESLPFGHISILSEHDFGGTGLFLTNGIHGCWYSETTGDAWEPWEYWTPAFEPDFVPLDVAVLTPGPWCWGVLALDVSDVPDQRPRVWFRMTHDAGETWADPIELGELTEDAWVWGCGLLSGHTKGESFILVANSNRLLWISHDTGETFEPIDAPPEPTPEPTEGEQS